MVGANEDSSVGAIIAIASAPNFRKWVIGVLNDTPFLTDHNGPATTELIGSDVRNLNINAVRKTKT